MPQKGNHPKDSGYYSIGLAVGQYTIARGRCQREVKALDDSHLLVILTAQEAGSLGLGAKVLREGADGCRAVMERLLAAACRQTGFSCERRRGQGGDPCHAYG